MELSNEQKNRQAQGMDHWEVCPAHLERQFLQSGRKKCIFLVPFDVKVIIPIVKIDIYHISLHK